MLQADSASLPVRDTQLRAGPPAPCVLRVIALQELGLLPGRERYALVNAEMEACGPPHVRRAGDQPAGGMLAAALAAVITAMTDGSWQHMKARAAGDCR